MSLARAGKRFCERKMIEIELCRAHWKALITSRDAIASFWRSSNMRSVRWRDAFCSWFSSGKPVWCSICGSFRIESWTALIYFEKYKIFCTFGTIQWSLSLIIFAISVLLPHAELPATNARNGKMKGKIIFSPSIVDEWERQTDWLSVWCLIFFMHDRVWERSETNKSKTSSHALYEKMFSWRSQLVLDISFYREKEAMDKISDKKPGEWKLWKSVVLCYSNK